MDAIVELLARTLSEGQQEELNISLGLDMENNRFGKDMLYIVGTTFVDMKYGNDRKTLNVMMKGALLN